MRKVIRLFYLILLSFLYYLYNHFITYIPIHALRILILRLYLKRLGENCTILMGVEIRSGKNIEVGNHVVINKNVLLDGRGGRLVIEDHVDIAQETAIWTLEHDVHSPIHEAVGADVIIEDHVWVGARSTILPGVTLHRGAVVATNAVVTNDVQELDIVGGIPAKIIGKRKNALTYTLDFNPWFK